MGKDGEEWGRGKKNPCLKDKNVLRNRSFSPNWNLLTPNPSSPPLKAEMKGQSNSRLSALEAPYEPTT
jgi:hypothetical protein